MSAPESPSRPTRCAVLAAAPNQFVPSARFANRNMMALRPCIAQAKVMRDLMTANAKVLQRKAVQDRYSRQIDAGMDVPATCFVRSIGTFVRGD